MLAFTDSDCVPAPDWLDRGSRHIDAGADVVQGRTEAARDVRPLERTVWVTARGRPLRDVQRLLPPLGVRRRRRFRSPAPASVSASGPDARLRDLGFGEDTLLGWRVRRTGTSRFAADAVVRHHVFPRRPPRVGDPRAWNAGGFAALVREVPELRTSLLHRRVLLGHEGRIPLYAAVVLFVARRRRAGSALGHRIWAGNMPSRLRAAPEVVAARSASLPLALAVDLVTAASLVAGSIRARRVVL